MWIRLSFPSHNSQSANELTHTNEQRKNFRQTSHTHTNTHLLSVLLSQSRDDIFFRLFSFCICFGSVASRLLFFFLFSTNSKERVRAPRDWVSANATAEKISVGIERENRSHQLMKNGPAKHTFKIQKSQREPNKNKFIFLIYSDNLRFAWEIPVQSTTQRTILWLSDDFFLSHCCASTSDYIQFSRSDKKTVLVGQYQQGNTEISHHRV